MALGLFVGILIPIAQIPIAALLAVPARANVLVAALSTLISNPFTFPLIYFASYRVGRWALGLTVLDPQGAALTSAGDGSVATVGLALLLGLALLASIASALAFAGTWLVWRARILWKWRRRRRR